MLLGMMLPWSLVAADAGHLDAQQAAAGRWAEARFAGVLATGEVPAGLRVLANHDPVQRNARAGKPLLLGGREYRSGLYCHAVSQVVVRLPAPGARLTALVGVDSNADTRPGKGSVTFIVAVAGAEVFSSPLLHEGDAAVPVDVDLRGAAEFELRVGDGGDGISCDQADWADARVRLVDGRELLLGDLPILDDAAADLSKEPPFSFSLDGRSSKELLAAWPCEQSRQEHPDSITYNLVWRQPGGPLSVRCQAVAWRDYPAVEWTAWLANEGQARSGLVTELRGLDASFAAAGGAPWTVHYNTGSICEQRDFEPLTAALTTDRPLHLASAGGRGSNGTWPYMNVASAERGLILAVGWPGQWASDFSVDPTQRLALRAGQELTLFRLEPGETARTPLMVLLWHDGNVARSQNVWRRWMQAHNLPRPGGKLPPPEHAACSSHQFGEMIHADEASQIAFIDGYTDHGLGLDYWWMDAGWYPNQHGWPDTGTWEVDRQRFPRGLRAITDHGHDRGVKSIVWFEPERVAPGTWLYQQHGEWLMGADGGQKLLDLGNPAARGWLTEHVDGLLKSEGIDLYRQDHNIDPLDFWRGHDQPERQGLTENLYIQGYLAYWDELRRRHPNMLIDSCASGGRRNDLETMRRSVPLLRSDYIFEPVGQQCHTLGLAPWLPYFGSGYISTEPYTVRSTFCPAINTCWDVRAGADYAPMQARMKEWQALSELWSGDFYALLPYSRDDSVWAAWQFHRDDLHRGVVQVFRRASSAYEAARLRLNGLEPARRYRVRDWDAGPLGSFSGAELAEPGLLITLKQRPQAAVLLYQAEE